MRASRTRATFSNESDSLEWFDTGAISTSMPSIFNIESHSHLDDGLLDLLWSADIEQRSWCYCNCCCTRAAVAVLPAAPVVVHKLERLAAEHSLAERHTIEAYSLAERLVGCLLSICIQIESILFFFKMACNQSHQAYLRSLDHCSVDRIDHRQIHLRSIRLSKKKKKNWENPVRFSGTGKKYFLLGT